MTNSIPTHMTGVQLIAHGGDDCLQVRSDIPVPTMGSHDVLIKVSAAGVNNTDINTRIGWYAQDPDDSSTSSWSGESLMFPRIQGADVCGKIVAVGSAVNATRIGERVIVEPCLQFANGKTLSSPWYFGSECDGGFAEYTVVDSRHAFTINSKMSDTELASFPCSYSTAENMLTRANVVAQDKVLISGASGGVGSATIQLAKARGAYVIAIAGANKLDAILALGADKVIERSSDLVAEIGENSVDVVIDLVAGKQWPQFLKVLKPHSRYAVAGAIGGAFVELDLRTLYLKDLSFFGCTIISSEVFPNLVKLIEAQRIKPLVAATFALDEIAIAQAEFQKKAHIGKIVLTVT